MTAARAGSPAVDRWRRAATIGLLVLGIVMGILSFVVVMAMPDMAWHPARDAELRATYDAYRETGVLLIKATGSGSYGVQSPATGPYSFATWDDDPGSYIIASLMSHVTGSDSPYPGLKIAQGLLVAIPLVWLPLAVARVVGRTRAGLALVLLPLVVWLFNQGAVLVGTAYGLSDSVSTKPVYSLYGSAASLAFLSLSLIVLLSTYKLRLVALVSATVGIAVLAAAGNLLRSLSGMGIAIAVGVLWWTYARGRWRWVVAIAGAVATVVLAIGLQSGAMALINGPRADAVGQTLEQVPDAHTAWHSLYLGLSYPQPLNGQPSRFGVTWSDEFAWAQARAVDPNVVIASSQYDSILRRLYFEKVASDPVGAVKLYLHKVLYVGRHFGGFLLIITVGFVVGMAKRSRLRRRLGLVLAITLPVLLLGLIPAVLVMPMLYYYSELTAGLGLLSAVSLGVLAWSLTSWPSRIRARERARTNADALSQDHAPGVERRVSVVVPTEFIGGNGLDGIVRTLSQDDELLLVCGHEGAAEQMGTGATGPSVRVITCADGAGVGTRLRTGVLASSGDRVLVVGGCPAGDVWDWRSGDAPKADLKLVEGVSNAREVRGAAVDRVRRMVLGTPGLGDTPVFIVDGPWLRAFASASREHDGLWFDELAFAARLDDMPVVELSKPAQVSDAAILTSGRTGFGQALMRYVRIAFRREEYATLTSEPGAAVVSAD